MTLAALRAGQSGRIAAVGGTGALRRRLLDMGITPHTEVTVRKLAPMGDPIQITLRGYELTLRKEDAANIELECTAGEASQACMDAHKHKTRRHGYTHLHGHEAEHTHESIHSALASYEAAQEHKDDIYQSTAHGRKRGRL